MPSRTMTCDCQQIPASGAPDRLRGGPREVSAHNHTFSPKTYTRHQLPACPALKEFLRTDYRGLAEHLADRPDSARLIGLKDTPHHTTPSKAADRLLRPFRPANCSMRCSPGRCERTSASGARPWRRSMARVRRAATSAATTPNDDRRPEPIPGKRPARSIPRLFRPSTAPAV